MSRRFACWLWGTDMRDAVDRRERAHDEPPTDLRAAVVVLLARVDELERRVAAHDRSLRSAFDAIGP